MAFFPLSTTLYHQHIKVGRANKTFSLVFSFTQHTFFLSVWEFALIYSLCSPLCTFSLFQFSVDFFFGGEDERWRVKRQWNRLKIDWGHTLIAIEGLKMLTTHHKTTMIVLPLEPIVYPTIEWMNGRGSPQRPFLARFHHLCCYVPDFACIMKNKQ